ncbi:hypothetical protein DFH28DRAFT_1219981, partial [Melampsora americana]
MEKDDTCPLKPCAFGGVYQPRLKDSFKTETESVGVSYLKLRLKSRRICKWRSLIWSQVKVKRSP